VGIGVFVGVLTWGGDTRGISQYFPWNAFWRISVTIHHMRKT